MGAGNGNIDSEVTFDVSSIDSIMKRCLCPNGVFKSIIIYMFAGLNAGSTKSLRAVNENNELFKSNCGVQNVMCFRHSQNKSVLVNRALQRCIQ